MTLGAYETKPAAARPGSGSRALFPGVLWFVCACVAAFLLLYPGLFALVQAWTKPEYSHGPLIPLISGYLLLRHLKEAPPQLGPVNDRWPGVAVMIVALLLGLAGALSGIHDLSAYAIIIWVAGFLLIGFGWAHGRQFWPPVVHLVFMLPLPGVIYYKVTTSLQFLSSEIGVEIVRAMGIPVFLDGNIIDLGVYKLHVAEACSGLRYLFPVMSFTYIFAVLYRGPGWQKVILLLAAVPIAVLTNSFRIGVIGVMVDSYGIEYAEGFTHFFEGWAVFGLTIALMLGLSLIMHRARGARGGMLSALDLDMSGLGSQISRIGGVRFSPALMVASSAMAFAGALLLLAPMVGLERKVEPIERTSFFLFPRQVGEWRTTSDELLAPSIEEALGATDYLARRVRAPDTPAEVDLFVAWYADQSAGGVHSPEICLPGGGWEIASINAIEVAVPTPGGDSLPIVLNRAIIQKGLTRQMVYYWFDQRGRRLASDYLAKMYLVVDGTLTGRSDGALIRLITPILPKEDDADAERRLKDVLAAIMPEMPRFIETEWPRARVR